jgi:hypothetical protein
MSLKVQEAHLVDWHRWWARVSAHKERDISALSQKNGPEGDIRACLRQFSGSVLVTHILPRL